MTSKNTAADTFVCAGRLRITRQWLLTTVKAVTAIWPGFNTVSNGSKQLLRSVKRSVKNSQGINRKFYDAWQIIQRLLPAGFSAGHRHVEQKRLGKAARRPVADIQIGAFALRYQAC